MDYNTVRALLDRYFAADTSAAEEAALHDYFRKGPVDPRLAAHAAWFDYLRLAREQQLPAGWQGQLHPYRPRLRPWRMAAAIAAALLLLLLALSGIYRLPSSATTKPVASIDWSHYEVEDPQEAARILNASLRKAGDGLRTGGSEAGRELQRLERLVEPID